MNYSYNVSEIRNEFPVIKNILYLDTAHQSPLSTPVRAALNQFYDEALNAAGPKPVWMGRIETTRKKVADLLGAQPNEIAFTKNTSEGLNIAANAVPLKAGDNVLLIEGDHPNNAYAWLNLKKKGVEVRFVRLPSESAIATAETFAPYIDDRTKAISLSHVTFHAGQRHDIGSIGQLCKQRGIYLIVDAMQSVGVLPLDVKQLGVSILAAGCHKGLLVPQGLGILYVQDDLSELVPTYLATAGLANPPSNFIAKPDDLVPRSDAGRFELGNYNLPDLHALAASIDLLTGIQIKNVEEHVLSLGDYLIDKLDALGIGLVGPRERLHRAHIYVLDLPADIWIEYFTSANVRVSPERDGMRISFGVFNTFEDVDKVIEVIERRSGRTRID
jgi:cysteine desulfurase / selenocysteine lyase